MGPYPFIPGKEHQHEGCLGMWQVHLAVRAVQSTTCSSQRRCGTAVPSKQSCGVQVPRRPDLPLLLCPLPAQCCKVQRQISTNPTRIVRATADGYPCQATTPLGTDGSLDASSWGHLKPQALAQVSFTSLRLAKQTLILRFAVQFKSQPVPFLSFWGAYSLVSAIKVRFRPLSKYAGCGL